MSFLVDRGVIATASELFEARHYPSVVAVCTDALDAEPECVPLLVLRARAHIALRRDLDAQADLRDIIRLDPRCGLAYRMLGELAARRDENDSAAIFFREALRLTPDDLEARDWLAIVDASPRPAVTRVASPPRAGDPPRFGRGTHPAQPPSSSPDALAATPAPLPPPPNEIATRSARTPASTKEPAPFVRISNPPPVPSPAGPTPRAATPELPGFGEYLVSTGILTRERLRAAQAYQRSMKVQLATSIVTLGLASPQRIAWAAVAHQSQLARDRQQPQD